MHCTRGLTAQDIAVRYPKSRALAHLTCVSAPSFDAMDRLLLAAAHAK